MTADSNAPTRYTDKDLKEVANYPNVINLSQRRQHLIGTLRDKYGFIRNAPSTDPTVKERASVEAALHTLKEKLRNKYFIRDRKRFFRTADTIILEAQLNNGKRSDTVRYETPPLRPPRYKVEDRGWVVGLIYDHIADLIDHKKLIRRIDAIKKRAILCDRQELRYRSRVYNLR